MLFNGRDKSPCGSRSEKNGDFKGTKSHFHEETKGRARHTAWSLEHEPRHLFVFGFHGATWARENSALGLRRVGSRSRLALGLLGMAFAVLWLPTQA